MRMRNFLLGLAAAVLLCSVFQSATPLAAQDSAAQDSAEESPAELQLRLAEAFRDLERHDDAIEAYTEAIALAPEQPLLYLRLGTLLATLERLEEARPHLEQAVELAPRDPAGHYALGEVHRSLAEWPDALEHYQLVRALAPGDENGAIGLAEALVGSGRFGDALALLEGSLEQFPESRGLRYGLAWMLSSSPDPELRDGARALELSQQLFVERRSIGAVELLAAARAESGDCEGALEMQKFMIEQSLEFERPEAELERAYEAQGWFESSPCRVPAGRPVTERALWPRARPAADSS